VQILRAGPARRRRGPDEELAFVDPAGFEGPDGEVRSADGEVVGDPQGATTAYEELLTERLRIQCVTARRIQPSRNLDRPFSLKNRPVSGLAHPKTMDGSVLAAP
jgi:hypothetical protein